MLFICLWFVKSMLFSRVTLPLISSIQSAAIWRQLNSLCPAACGTCQCCQTVRSDLEFQRVYEILSRLRKEFEPRRAKLLACGRAPISESFMLSRSAYLVLGC
jgi:hypothetical protein